MEEYIDINREKINVSAKISEKREHQGIRFGITPMWLRHTDLSFKLKARVYHLLYELITFDFRYKPDKYGYFFINTPAKFDNCFDYLGNMVGTKGKTVVKKLLPLLKDFVSYRKDNNTVKFQIKWDNLFEVYRKCVSDIPFSEGGLQDIPEDATGILKPTPYHTIYIQDGKVIFMDPLPQMEQKENLNNEKELEREDIKKTFEEYDSKQKIKLEKQKKSSSDKIKPKEPDGNQSDKPSEKKYSEQNKELIKKLHNIGVSKSQIKKCMDNIELTKNVLKYFDEMPPGKKNKIENKAGYICQMILKEEFTPPDTFIPQEAVEEAIQRRIASEKFGKKIEKKFRSGEITHFIPAEGKKLTISLIPNKTMFLYINQKGNRVCGVFRDWMEDKYFQ